MKNKLSLLITLIMTKNTISNIFMIMILNLTITSCNNENGIKQRVEEDVKQEIEKVHKKPENIQHKSTSSINNEWPGTYTGSFLRMKDESGDPRGWGQIKIEIGKASAKFHLDSYVENIKRELEIVHADAEKIQFAAADDKNLMLTMLLDKDKYQLSGSLMDSIVGVKETYELKKLID
ncbi:hypothetical protein D3C87_219270 [compost metagenome]